SAFLKPWPLASLADFEAVFGGPFRPIFDIDEVASSPPNLPYDFQVGNSQYDLVPVGNPQFYLYNSLRLFFNNGGANCYVVSVGDYTNGGNSPLGVMVSPSALQAGLDAVHDQVGPTMLVIPDAALLDNRADYSNIAQAMLKQAGELQD